MWHGHDFLPTQTVFANAEAAACVSRLQVLLPILIGRIAGLINPGDYVDVVLTQVVEKPGAFPGQRLSRPWAQNQTGLKGLAPIDLDAWTPGLAKGKHLEAVGWRQGPDGISGPVRPYRMPTLRDIPRASSNFDPSRAGPTKWRAARG